jgi:hypothetical protein
LIAERVCTLVKAFHPADKADAAASPRLSAVSPALDARASHQSLEAILKEAQPALDVTDFRGDRTSVTR